MDVVPINTKADYKAALKTVEFLMDARAHTPQGNRVSALVTLIETHERKHFPMDPHERP